MIALFKELARDSKTNFLLLFQTPHEDVTFIDQYGRKQTFSVAIKKPENPMYAIKSLTWRHWLLFVCGFVAILADMVDFLLLIILNKSLATYFHATKAEMSMAVTYTALAKPIGAIGFGITSDYTGRKYPLVVTCFMLGLLQMGSIYCTNLNTFLGVRALFGIGMGGIWGCATSAGINGCPVPARGLMSGLLLSAGPCAYLVGSCIVLSFGTQVTAWKSAFWVGAALSLFAGLFRLVVPDFKEPENGESSKQGIHDQPTVRGMAKVKQFFHDLKLVLKTSWKRFFYMTFFVTTVHCLLMVSVSAYATFTMVSKGFEPRKATKLGIAVRVGGIIGSIFIASMSQYAGRRRMMLICCFFLVVLIPAYILPSSFGGLAAGGFFFHFFLEGVMGIMAVHLNELSPSSLRAMMPGTAFQLGSLFAAGSTTMVNLLSETHHVMYHGKEVEAYGPVMMILIAVCAIQLIQIVAVGPENHGNKFIKDETSQQEANFNATPMTTFSSHGTRSQFSDTASEKHHFK